MIDFLILGSILFWVIAFILALYWVPKLIINSFKRSRHLKRLVKANGWLLEQTSSPKRPPELVGETLSNIAADDDEYYNVNVVVRIDGVHRGRSFTLLTFIQDRTKKRRAHSTDSTYIFTPLPDTSNAPPMFMYFNSAVLDGVQAIDSAAKASAGKLRAFPKVAMPSPFCDSYTVRGLEGTRDFLTQEVQNAILEKPHLFRRQEEKWHKRFGTLPGLTEHYAYLNIQALDPHTLENRLDSLMDWAEIASMKISD